MKTILLIILFPLFSFSQTEPNNTKKDQSVESSKNNIVLTNNNITRPLIIIKSTIVETQYKQYQINGIRIDALTKDFIVPKVKKENNNLIATE